LQVTISSYFKIRHWKIQN